MQNKAFILNIMFLFIIIAFLYFLNDARFENSLIEGYFMRPENRLRKHVFIDLGANKGDSIYNFLGISEKAGGGGQLSGLIDYNIIKNDNWEIFGFEGNPIFDQVLTEMKTDVEAKNKNVKIHLYNSTLAWTYDGRIDFYLDLVNKQYDYWGRLI